MCFPAFSFNVDTSGRHSGHFACGPLRIQLLVPLAFINYYGYFKESKQPTYSIGIKQKASMCVNKATLTSCIHRSEGIQNHDQNFFLFL